MSSSSSSSNQFVTGSFQIDGGVSLSFNPQVITKKVQATSSSTTTSSASVPNISATTSLSTNTHHHDLLSSSPSSLENKPSLSKRYVYDKFLAKGGFGAVFLAHEKDDESKKVAIKIATETGANRELRRECVLLTQLAPDLNVVNVLDVEREITTTMHHQQQSQNQNQTQSTNDVQSTSIKPSSTSASAASSSATTTTTTTGERIGLVMEYCSGGSLLDHIHSREQMKIINQNNTSNIDNKLLFSEPEAAFMILQILSGLSFLHGAGITHRDIKAGNILLSSSSKSNSNSTSSSLLLKIADFGLIQSAASASPASSSLVGTVSYLSPETLLEGQSSQKSDIWSVGCVLSQIFTGQPPWNAVRMRCHSQAQQFFEMRRVLLSSSSTTSSSNKPKQANSGNISKEELGNDDAASSSSASSINKVIEEYLIPSNEEGDLLSEDARQFLAQLLNSDPLKRPTAKQIVDECFAILDHQETTTSSTTTTTTNWIMNVGGEEVRSFLRQIREFNEQRYANCLHTVKYSRSPLARVVLARLLPNETWIDVGGKMETRQGLFNDACNLEPENDLWYFLLASELESQLQQNSTRAMILQTRIQNCYEKCVEISPTDATYWLRLGLSVKWRAKLKLKRKYAVLAHNTTPKDNNDNNEDNDEDEYFSFKIVKPSNEESKYVVEQLSARHCLIRALELDDSLALAWSYVGNELKRWNMTKTVEIKGNKYSYYDCLKKAAEIIERTSTGSLSSSSSGNLSIFEEQEQLLRRTSTENNNNTTTTTSKSSEYVSSLLPRVFAASATSSPPSRTISMMTHQQSSSSLNNSAGSASSSSLPTTDQQHQQMPLELVTAVVTKGQPREFWKGLGRAIPLLLNQPKKETNTTDDMLSSTSRSECFKKALDCDSTSDQLLWLEFAIALFYDSEISDEDEDSRKELISKALVHLLENAQITSENQSSPSSSTTLIEFTNASRWKYLSWIFCSQLMKKFGIESLMMMSHSDNSNEEKQEVLTLSDCAKRAIEHVKNASVLHGTEAWIIKNTSSSVETLQEFLSLFSTPSSLENDIFVTTTKLKPSISRSASTKQIEETQQSIEIVENPVLASLIISFYYDELMSSNLKIKIPKCLKLDEAFYVPDNTLSTSNDNEDDNIDTGNLHHQHLLDISFLSDEQTCFDVSGRQNTDGAPIQSYRRNTTVAQRFYLVQTKTNPSLYYIKSLVSDKMFLTHGELFEQLTLSSSTSTSNPARFRILVHHSESYYGMQSVICQIATEDGRGVLSLGDGSIGDNSKDDYYQLMKSSSSSSSSSSMTMQQQKKNPPSSTVQLRTNVPVTIVPSYSHPSTTVRLLLNPNYAKENNQKGKTQKTYNSV